MDRRSRKARGTTDGRWFAPDSKNEVVLGFEAAEYEQRKVGDTFYASITPAGKPDPVMHEFKVVGVLDRTGTQDDGTVFMPIDVAREYFGRPEQLTILGIKLKQFNALQDARVRDALAEAARGSGGRAAAGEEHAGEPGSDRPDDDRRRRCDRRDRRADRRHQHDSHERV